MSSKSSPAAPKSSDTPQSILGTLTQERVNQVRDQGVRELALACIQMAQGIAQV
ncbi:MAG: hypothetical protein JST54_35865, partial [Deltaproteobacteria bacterium]|nr:hypothetical protein [Deltaproteobacteria bacterium]